MSVFCSSCGFALSSEDKFCFKCGCKVKSERIISSRTAVATREIEIIPSATRIQPVIGRSQAYYPQFHYAGFWIRLFACLIDCTLWVVFSFSIISMPIAEEILPTLAVIIAWLYYAMLESSTWQGTLGKKMCGIVVSDTNGERISFIRASFRYPLHLFSNILLIGYLMIAFTNQKRGLHDFMAGTLVHYKRDGGAL